MAVPVDARAASGMGLGLLARRTLARRGLRPPRSHTDAARSGLAELELELVALLLRGPLCARDREIESLAIRLELLGEVLHELLVAAWAEQSDGRWGSAAVRRVPGEGRVRACAVCAGRVWRVSLLPVLRDGHGGGRARLRGGGRLRHVVDYDVCARAGGGSTREQAVAVTICREKGEWDGAEGRVRRRAGRRRGWQRRRVGPHAAGRAAVVRGGGGRIFLLCRSVCDVCARRTLCTPRVAAGCRKRAVAGWAMRRAAPTAAGVGRGRPRG